MSKIYKDQIFPNERDLYNLQDIEVINCKFDGIEDGESALKECSNVKVKNCYFNLRYSLWCVNHCTVENSELTDKCRSPIWYSKNMLISNSILNCVKVFRMCEDITVKNCTINSIEFGWNAKNFTMENCTMESVYPFLRAENVTVKNCTFNTNYAFQQAKHVYLENVTITSKDPFWDCEDVKCVNCTFVGDFLGWHSKGITLIDCTIISSQPLCYADDLTVTNCIMKDCDLAFEYSNVQATINGYIKSVKNPSSGSVVADEIGEIITGNSAHPANATVKSIK